MGKVVFSFIKKLIIFSLPLILWADNSAMCSGLNIFDQVVSGCSNIAIFEPSQYDLSLTFLRMIFGSVGTALYGMSNPLVGTIFRIFNTGVLLITSCLITYAIFLTVIGGSQDGSPMGGNSKGMLNPWVVTRIVGGAAMLIPSFSGYSAMQVLVMYTVVQGVGFADTVWTASLDYIAGTGNSVISQPVDSNASNMKVLSDYNGMMDRLYRSSLCMIENRSLSTSLCTSTPDSCTISYTQSASYDMLFVTYPFNCGSYTLSIRSIAGEQDSTTYQKYSAMMQTAIGQSISILESAAQASMQSVTAILTSFPNASYADAGDALQSSAACTATYCSVSSAYAAASSTYMDTVNYVWQTLNPPANLEENTSWTTSASSRGWISAGMYYFDLSRSYISGTGSSSSSSAQTGPTSQQLAAYVPSGSPPMQPGAPSTADMVYPMQVESAYYFNYAQTICFNDCSQSPHAECIACQTIAMIDDMSAAQESMSGSSAASAEADEMYTGLLQQIFKLLKNIDDYDYCSLLPNGIAGGWIALDQCVMVMPLARFNRLVLGGTLRVVLGLNSAFWEAESDSNGKSCASDWNGDLKHTVQDIIQNNGHSEPNHCKDKADACRKSKDPLTDCSFDKLYEPCMTDMYGFFPFLYNASNGGYMDPIFSSSQIGMQMMGIAVNYWTTVTKDVFDSVMDASWALFGISVPLQIAGDLTVASMYGTAPILGGLVYALMQAAVNIMKMFFEMSKAVLEMYLPLGASLTAIVFGLGAMMGIYMPFMPFMLYLFGVIGWLMAVIEGMVAAPLVALGITHPEGHDLLGKSEQAMMLLLGVFIRPVTMIMGLLFAMNLAQVAVQLLDYGFLFVFTDISNMNNSSSDALTNGFIVLGAMVVYCYVLMTIIDQAYSLIYQVPDKILRWIGGPQDTSSIAQMVNQVKGQTQQLGSKGGEAGSSTAGRAPSVGGATASGSRYGKQGRAEQTKQAKSGISSSDQS